jgi:hypothetical protein
MNVTISFPEYDVLVALAVYVFFATPSSAVTVYVTPCSVKKFFASPDAGFTVAPGDTVIVGVNAPSVVSDE